MKDMNIDFKDPIIQVMLVLLLVLFAGAWAGYNYLLLPLREEVSAKEEELSGLENELDRVRAVANRLPMIQQEVEKLNERLEDVSTKLPSQKQVARLIVQLTNAAVTRDVVIRDLKPDPVSSGGSAVVESHPIQVTATSTYHNLAEFFADVANFKRIMKVERVNIQPLSASDLGHNVQADFTVIAYAFKEGVAPVGGGGGGGEGNEDLDW